MPPVEAQPGCGTSHPPLVERAPEIGAALVDHVPDLPEPVRSWLRRQYAEVVPVVVVDALQSVDSGEPLPPDCLDRARAIGARHAGEDIPMEAALRGALPAMQVAATLLRESSPARALSLMHRAGVVGQEVVSAWMEGYLRARSAYGSAPGAVVAADEPALEPQERAILQLVADGRSNAQIAEATHYSRQAVTWYLSRLMRRWRAPNRSALVAAGFARGVLGAGRRGSRDR